MKISVEQAFVSDQREVKVQVAEGQKWIDFGFMNYTERWELAKQLRAMANELMKGPS